MEVVRHPDEDGFRIALIKLFPEAFGEIPFLHGVRNDNHAPLSLWKGEVHVFSIYSMAMEKFL